MLGLSPLSLDHKVILTCALTGTANTKSKNPNVPVTPKEIAEDAIAAAKAGASIVHIHVRDPETAQEARDPALFKELVDRIRDSSTDIVINLTSAVGVDVEFDLENPCRLTDNTDFLPPMERLAHIDQCRPEICSLDIANMIYGDSNPYLNLPEHVRIMARQVREWGVKPEIEVFNLGDLWLAKDMIEEGLFEEPPFIQLVMGARYGAEATTKALMAMMDHLPKNCVWSALGVSAKSVPIMAQSILLGGHARVGLEDNLYLRRGELATNAALVEQAKKVVGHFGLQLATPAEARQMLGIPKK